MIWAVIYHGAIGDQSYSIKSKYDNKVIQTNPLEGVIIVTLHMNEVLNLHYSRLTPPTLRVTGWWGFLVEPRETTSRPRPGSVEKVVPIESPPFYHFEICLKMELSPF